VFEVHVAFTVALFGVVYGGDAQLLAVGAQDYVAVVDQYVFVSYLCLLAFAVGRQTSLELLGAFLDEAVEHVAKYGFVLGVGFQHDHFAIGFVAVLAAAVGLMDFVFAAHF
jgi:hypothetical protein